MSFLPSIAYIANNYINNVSVCLTTQNHKIIGGGGRKMGWPLVLIGIDLPNNGVNM